MSPEHNGEGDTLRRQISRAPRFGAPQFRTLRIPAPGDLRFRLRVLLMMPRTAPVPVRECPEGARRTTKWLAASELNRRVGSTLNRCGQRSDMMAKSWAIARFVTHGGKQGAYPARELPNSAGRKLAAELIRSGDIRASAGGHDPQ